MLKYIKDFLGVVSSQHRSMVFPVYGWLAFLAPPGVFDGNRDRFPLRLLRYHLDLPR